MDRTEAVIEVFADLACPFTHVGLRRFVERRAELGRSDVVLRVRAWPLELVNSEPLDAAFIAEEVATIRHTVTPEMFEGFDESTFPSTSLPGFALVAAAYRHDDATGETVSLELRDLLFEEGIDISDSRVLAGVAERHGLKLTERDHGAAVTDQARGRERGVIGSPHFFTPAGDYFCPSLDVGRDENDELQVSFDPAAFEDFVAGCFSIRS